jgi:predicted CXXCH cytochrome family protein
MTTEGEGGVKTTNRSIAGRLGAVAFGITAMLTVGCTETEIQFVDREPFNPPPDAAAGFLGYYTPSDKQTTCGNCHAGSQAAWLGTKHAMAWEDLQANPGAQDFCTGCHTVSELGNAVDSAAGYNRVADSAYHDVQCESCHGPGLEHVESVAAGSVVRPFASIAVDTVGTNGCAGCHEGTHHPFVEQWAESKHGFAGAAYIEEGGRSPCNTCHEGREAIRVNFGEEAPFVEKGVPGEEGYQPIVCSVCHDPHSAFNEGQLRAPLGEPTREQLCVKCHSREGHPPSSGTTRRGPHAAQGLLVIDEDVGWIPPNFQYDTTKIVSSHGTVANPRLCAACHVYMFDVTDAATGDFLLTSVGHTFEAIQCLDAQGLPTAGPCPDSQRQFGSCAVSGCHTSADGARGAFQAVRLRMNFLVDQLWNDVDGDGVLEATDGGMLPDVLAQAIAANNLSEINLYDNVLTPAEGAIWNAQLARTNERPAWSSFRVAGQLSCTPTTTCTTQGSSNTSHKSSGEGVHNPFKLEALLLASISYLQSYYALPAPPVDLSPQLAVPPGVRVLR